MVDHRDAGHNPALSVGDSKEHLFTMGFHHASYSQVSDSTLYMDDGTGIGFPQAGLAVLHFPRTVSDVLVFQQLVVMSHQPVLVLYAEGELIDIHILSR